VQSRTRSVFPLVPKHRVAGLPLGGTTSLRRGHGSDVAGSRAYVRGDPVSTIDWRASARLSTARGRDEFVVRERYAEEAARVVVLCDFRPSMGLYPPNLPWLSKPDVVRSAVDLIGQSALAAHTSLAYLDYDGDGERNGAPFWIAPQSRDALPQIEQRQTSPHRYDAPEDTLEQGFRFLTRPHSSLSSGTFIFVLSDFLGPGLTDSAVLGAAARRWEIVPVVVQDPTWEQSFPVVGPLVLGLADPGGGERLEVRLSRRAAQAQREANAQRYRDTLARLALLGLEPLALTSAEPAVIDQAFLDWASRRQDLRQRR
jgi:uncharacterized protein (DUF58 family)